MSEWQPAVVRSADENWEHAIKYNPTAVNVIHPRMKQRAEAIAGKKILVRPVYDATEDCGCGQVQLEVEPKSAKAALPEWGATGRRPTICSGHVITD